MPAAATPNSPQHQLLAESLHLLVLAHYVLAAITALMTPLGLYLIFVGWGLLHPARADAWTPRRGQEMLDPVLWGTVFYLGGGALASLAIVHAGLIAYIGRQIARRRRRKLCLAFSVFDLTYVPLGTTLSVFTLLLLLNPAARDEFSAAERVAPEIGQA